MFKRKDFKVITITVSHWNGFYSRHHGILIAKNKRWLHLWQVDNNQINGRVLVRRSHVSSYDEIKPKKMSKLQYRAMKKMGELDKIDPKLEIKLSKSDKKMLNKTIANKAFVVSQSESGKHIGIIQKIGKTHIYINECYTGDSPQFKVCIEKVHMLIIDSRSAVTYPLFSK